MFLCSRLKYEFVKAPHDVVRFNEHGDKFFVILVGLVSIHVPNPEKKHVLEARKEDPTAGGEEDVEAAFDDLFIEVAKLEGGQSFGELALISSKPRAATIRCKKDTHFAVLDKNAYQKSF